MMDHTRRAYETATASALLVSIVAMFPGPPVRQSLPWKRPSTDCRVWPPPIKDDPDRLISGSAGA